MKKDEFDDNVIHFNIPVDKSYLYVDNSKTNYNFKFDAVFPMNATQEEVFNKVGRPAVMNALEGYNSTVFAYGQTGSGKTFTITGGSERYVDRGIIPRSLSLMFAEFQTRADYQFTAHISYFQIYMERGYDLLDEKSGGANFQSMPSVKLMEDEWGNAIMQNLTMHLCRTEEDALNLLFLGDVNRAYASTAMNETSSRSHCIFTISIEGKKPGSDMVKRSKLHLVDLAGSERIKKSGADGQTLKEAQYINKSLFFLEMVIVALHEKATKGKDFIPYRNSFLTTVLRDSLGGNCKTIMIANISGEEQHTHETVGTCRFAQRVASIKNEAIINEDMDPSLMIKRLKDEVKRLKGEVDFLKGESGEGDMLTDEERENLIQRCKEYVDNPDPYAELNVSPLTLVKIKDCFAILKNFVLEARQNGPSEGKSANSGEDVSASGAGSDVEDLLRQIKELKKKNQERENEIAILVNMVKQGKSIGNGVLAIPGQQNTQEPSAPEAKQARKLPEICSKVPFPRDKSVLADAQQSFEYFKGLYPSTGATEDNKAILREKYTEAKTLGEAVNKARGKINYLKNTIEQLRREKAIEGLLEKEEKEGSEVPVDPEEEALKAQIDEEKQVYKDSFTALKSLKAEIEHIQMLLQKTSKKMQADFDTWYAVALETEETETKESLPQPKRAWGTPDTSSRQRGAVPDVRVSEEKPEPSTFTNGVKFPPLTGNKEADEDIIAFYKAKEELLKRSRK